MTEILTTVIGIAAVAVLVLTGTAMAITDYRYYKRQQEMWNRGYCPDCGMPYSLSRFSNYDDHVRIYFCSGPHCRRACRIQSRRIDGT